MVYVFYSKQDANREVIGRVTSTGLTHAREMIAGRKNLPIKVIDELFIIERLVDYEKHVR